MKKKTFSPKNRFKIGTWFLLGAKKTRFRNFHRMAGHWYALVWNKAHVWRPRNGDAGRVPAATCHNRTTVKPALCDATRSATRTVFLWENALLRNNESCYLFVGIVKRNHHVHMKWYMHYLSHFIVPMARTRNNYLICQLTPNPQAGLYAEDLVIWPKTTMIILQLKNWLSILGY